MNYLFNNLSTVDVKSSASVAVNFLENLGRLTYLVLFFMLGFVTKLLRGGVNTTPNPHPEGPVYYT
jgi:hypothetical protein